MKKMLALVLALVMVLTAATMLSSCKKNAGDKDTRSPEQKAYDAVAAALTATAAYKGDVTVKSREENDDEDGTGYYETTSTMKENRESFVKYYSKYTEKGEEPDVTEHSEKYFLKDNQMVNIYKDDEDTSAEYMNEYEVYTYQSRMNLSSLVEEYIPYIDMSYEEIVAAIELSKTVNYNFPNAEDVENKAEFSLVCKNEEGKDIVVLSKKSTVTEKEGETAVYTYVFEGVITLAAQDGKIVSLTIESKETETTAGKNPGEEKKEEFTDKLTMELSYAFDSQLFDSLTEPENISAASEVQYPSFFSVYCGKKYMSFYPKTAINSGEDLMNGLNGMKFTGLTDVKFYTDSACTKEFNATGKSALEVKKEKTTLYVMGTPTTGYAVVKTEEKNDLSAVNMNLLKLWGYSEEDMKSRTHYEVVSLEDSTVYEVDLEDSQTATANGTALAKGEKVTLSDCGTANIVITTKAGYYMLFEE